MREVCRDWRRQRKGGFGRHDGGLDVLSWEKSQVNDSCDVLTAGMAS